ncbi:dephospho-CoA kinase [Streptomyces sp. NP160]|uniref:dephospho-CoA kinase n=1 Tax=Streptomyces sp. NP160 TaxID=2586637 RepID=UPI0011185A89|nr:dephospho-CoA kinase [Streptomyces sp. NP160]TNM64592.1 dephospho-CoA kinase [Streptomyces sp. NP160]
MLFVGLTGGVGAGKSTAAAALRELGAVVVDADAIAREVVAPGTPGLAAVVTEFGEGVLGADGALDRPALGTVVFADPQRRRALEAITHPLVLERTEALVAAAVEADPAAVVVHDIPLLVELRRTDRYHLVLAVMADEEVRLRRLVQGRGMDDGDARARIAAQADDDARRAAADVLLDGSGSPEDLAEQLRVLWEERLLPYEADLRAGRRAPRPEHPVLVPPDPGWAAAGERLVARVARAAGERALDVQHTGSTAVPGLLAKDCIDLQVVCADLASAREVAADLRAAGLVAAPGEWWDEPVSRRGQGDEAYRRVPKAMAFDADPGRRVNCHVRHAANPEAHEVLAFRDALRVDPHAREAYALLKRGLAARHRDVEEYAAAKTDFIAEVLSRSS